MRRGTSLIEATVFLAIGLLVIVLAMSLHARLGHHDTWNAAWLSSVESVLSAWDHVGTDLRCAAGHAEVTERGLEVDRSVAATGASTEHVSYLPGVGRGLERAGRALPGVKVDALKVRWRDETAGLLDVGLESGGDRVEASAVNRHTAALTMTVQLVDRARHAEFPSWVDGE